MLRALVNLTIRAKVIGALLAVLVVTWAFGSFAITRMGAMNDQAADVRDNRLPSTRVLGRIAALIEEYRQQQATPVLDPRPDVVAAQEKRLRVSFDAIEKARGAYEPMVSPGEQHTLADRIGGAWKAYDEHSRDLEISRNVQQAATGTQDVSNHIIGVKQAATEVLGAAKDLLRQSAELCAEVDHFIADVQAA